MEVKLIYVLGRENFVLLVKYKLVLHSFVFRLMACLIIVSIHQFKYNQFNQISKYNSIIYLQQELYHRFNQSLKLISTIYSAQKKEQLQRISLPICNTKICKVISLMKMQWVLLFLDPLFTEELKKIILMHFIHLVGVAQLQIQLSRVQLLLEIIPILQLQ